MHCKFKFLDIYIHGEVLEIEKAELLCYHNIPDLNDEWLNGVAKAWASLRYLVLCGGHDPPRITLAGLIALIKHCSHLHFFAIALQLIPVDPALLEGANINIFRLSLQTSTLTGDSASQFTRSLMGMFPNLKEIDCSSASPSSGTGKDEWLVVQR